MAKQEGDEPFLTLKEAAEILNVTMKGLHRFIQEAPPNKRPPMYRILTNRIRIPRKEFLKWATSRKV